MRKNIAVFLLVLLFSSIPSVALAGGGRYAREFIGYEPSSTWSVYEYAERGFARMDNRNSTTEATLTYEQLTTGSCSHTWSETTQFQVEVQAEQIQVVNSVGLTHLMTVTWSSSTTLLATLPVPAGKVGYIYCHNTATGTAGTASWRVTYYPPSGGGDDENQNSVGDGAHIQSLSTWVETEYTYGVYPNGNTNFKTVIEDK